MINWIILIPVGFMILGIISLIIAGIESIPPKTGIIVKKIYRPEKVEVKPVFNAIFRIPMPTRIHSPEQFLLELNNYKFYVSVSKQTYDKVNVGDIFNRKVMK